MWKPERTSINKTSAQIYYYLIKFLEILEKNDCLSKLQASVSSNFCVLNTMEKREFCVLIKYVLREENIGQAKTWFEKCYGISFWSN